MTVGRTNSLYKNVSTYSQTKTNKKGIIKCQEKKTNRKRGVHNLVVYRGKQVQIIGQN